MRPRLPHLGGVVLVALSLATATTALAAPTAAAPPHWAADAIEQVVGAGVMGPSVAGFRPDDPLTRGELHEAILALGKSRPAPADPERRVTMRELDAQLVAALGLLPAARSIRLAARDAGLEPTDMLGTETVARLLGLRLNHPQGSEELERLPNEPAPRGEAAYSLARILSLDPARIAQIGELAAGFSLPPLGDWQTSVLGRALRFVGYPYVFAGTSEREQKLWSPTAAGGQVTVPGGFDCSGFVWRVYKLQPFDGAPLLAGVLKGRTTFAMSAEVKPVRRVALGALQPGDVIFFGSRGVESTPAQVGHAGIYVGNGWFVHSSSGGVTLQPLQGWYATSFAWARRPLAEAGLSA